MKSPHERDAAAVPQGRGPLYARRALPLPPQAVTFDCWKTLIVEADWELAHARRVGALVFAAEEAGLHVDTEAARDAFDAAWQWHMDEWVRGVATGAPEIARAALRLLGVDAARDATRTAMAHDDLVHEWQEASHTSRVHALDGARETLAALARVGVRRALVCDTGLTPGRVVRVHLRREGLLEQLETCVFSDEVGAPKPDPRTFRAALDTLGAAPTRSIHVGDLLRTDVAGARGLGMGTVRIRAAHDDTSELPEADAIVDSHADLRRLLDVG